LTKLAFIPDSSVVFSSKIYEEFFLLFFSFLAEEEQMKVSCFDWEFQLLFFLIIFFRNKFFKKKG